MEFAVRFVEIFAFISGIIYIILEIGQKNSMWVVGILTGLACSFSFAVQYIWASSGLNLYYVAVSVWGLYQWKSDSAKLRDRDSGASIHLGRLTLRSALLSLMLLVLGTSLLILLLRAMNGTETNMDALVTVMSAIATWWLAKSYLEQWLIWIVADTLSAVLCFVAGMNWMAVLYLAYALSAVYGYTHWKRNGEVVA